MSKPRGRLLFVNKKKQKNFCHLGRAGFSATGPSDQTFLAPLALPLSYETLAFPRKSATPPAPAPLEAGFYHL
jgi:hypothetical protein